jgi:DNA repair protein RecN (Recombination protein N)
MLTLLNISNFALIDSLRIEFEPGLNLLTGETGSGKSIIVDALGVLIGGRFSADLVKSGESRSVIEGLFTVDNNPPFQELLINSGIEDNGGEIIVRREFSAGRNKIFVNNQLATQSLLREIRPFLVDIHGQGDQQSLLDPGSHLDLLDAFAGTGTRREQAAAAYRNWSAIRKHLADLRRDTADRLQLVDILRFQIDELERAALEAGEEERLQEEKRRLMNIEKLSSLCADAFGLTYEEESSAFGRIGQAVRRVEELADYESRFRNYLEGLETARALLEDLGFALRDYSGSLEISPARLTEVDGRLAELARLKRKYGGSVESAIEHLAHARERLGSIEQSDERESELTAELRAATSDYLKHSRKLHDERVRAIKELERTVRRDLAEVAMEQARLEVRLASPPDADLAAADGDRFTARGFDQVEFLFSANAGEPVKQLARVASGGEASRLMLILKTVTNAAQFPRTIVFDEVDAGIGGRVSEAVGVKLKKLAQTHQVLCVTHQAQIARFADCHLTVLKQTVAGKTEVRIEKLDKRTRVEEIARMLTGADITEAARRHAREMLKMTSG